MLINGVLYKRTSFNLSFDAWNPRRLNIYFRRFIKVIAVTTSEAKVFQRLSSGAYYLKDAHGKTLKQLEILSTYAHTTAKVSCET